MGSLVGLCRRRTCETSWANGPTCCQPRDVDHTYDRAILRLKPSSAGSSSTDMLANRRGGVRVLGLLRGCSGNANSVISWSKVSVKPRARSVVCVRDGGGVVDRLRVFRRRQIGFPLDPVSGLSHTRVMVVASNSLGNSPSMWKPLELSNEANRSQGTTHFTVVQTTPQHRRFEKA